MFVTYEKSTTRGFVFNVTRIYNIIVALAAVGCTGMIFINSHRMSTMLIIHTALLWAETICTAMTFFEPVCAGPNSALLNLPLLAVDLMWVVIYSNVFFDDSYAFMDENVNPDVWEFRYNDISRSIAFLIVIARYTGLAWSDPNFYLKRLFAPVRVDTVKEFAPYDPAMMQAAYNPQGMMQPPMPMPI